MKHNDKKIYFLFIIVCIGIYFFINSNLLLVNPPIWPDEAEYADVSHTILTKNIFYSQFFPGITSDTHTIYWYPPLMFYFFAFLFKIFGFSPVTMRLAAVASGFIFITMFCILISRWIKQKALIGLAVILFMVDFFFMRAARIARPEIFILTLGILAYISIEYIKHWKGIVIAGFFIGAAMLFQLFGGVLMGMGVVLLLILKTKRFVQIIQKLLLFVFPIIAWFMWWLWIVHFNFTYLFENLRLQSLRKFLEPSFFSQISKSDDSWYASLLLSLFIGSVVFMIYILVQKKKTSLQIFSAILLAVTWVCIFKGKQYWYFVYIIPLFIASSISIIDTAITEKKYHQLSYAVICIIIFTVFVLNSIMFTWNYSYSVTNASYDSFSRSITQYIPSGSTVLVSAIPDPYFILKKNPTLRLYHFAALPESEVLYRRLLQESDYIVYTSSLDFVYGNLLSDYIKNHAISAIRIDQGKGGYKAYVIKMKK